MKQIVKWMSKNQGMSVAVAISALMSVWTFGCETRIGSLLSPDKLINKAELQLEVEQLTAKLESELELLIRKAEIKFAELDRQDEIKRMILEFGLLATEAGTVNPVGLIGLLGGIFGVGAAVDNRIKDKVIKNRPLKTDEA